MTNTRKVRRKYSLILVIFFLTNQRLYGQLNIEANLTKAEIDISENKNHEAIERLNKVIRFKPDNYRAYFNRGNAKIGLQDYFGAIEDYTNVISINPFYSDAYYNRGIAKSCLLDYNDAIIDYDRAANMSSGNPNLFYNRGLAKLNLKNYSAALEDFDQAIKLNSSMVQAYVLRGIVKAIFKQYESAIKDCNHAIRLNMFYDEAFLRRGLIKQDLKEFEEAINDYNFALKLNPDNAYTYYVRAIAKCKLKEFEGAMADYNKVVELNPYNALAYYNRAMLKIQMEKKNEAILDLAKVIELSPLHVLSYYNRGMLLGEQKKYHEGLEDFNKAIELYPDFGEAYYMRSLTKRSLGQLKSAEQDYYIAQSKIEAQNKDTTIAIVNAEKYQKLIELEADFNNNLVGGDRIYSVYSGIDPLPDYMLNINSEKSKKIIFSDLAANFKNNLDGLILIIDNHIDSTLDYKTISQKNDKTLKKDTGSFENWYIKGLIDTKLQNYNSAIYAFSKAINLKHNSAFAYLGRANAQLKMLDFINSIDEGINLTVDGKTKQINRKLEKTYDYNNILNDYGQAIEINPDLAIAYYNRANLKVKAKDFSGALFDYNRAIKLEPDFADAYYNIALLLIYQQNFSQACSALSKAGELGQEKAYLVIQRYCKK